MPGVHADAAASPPLARLEGNAPVRLAKRKRSCILILRTTLNLNVFKSFNRCCFTSANPKKSYSVCEMHQFVFIARL